MTLISYLYYRYTLEIILDRKNNGKQISEKNREDIQKWLQVDYKFYVMKAKSDVDDKLYISTHFKELIGKIYRPFEDKEIYSLALDKSHIDSNKELITKLKDYFTIVDCNLKDDPNEALAKAPITDFVNN